MSGSGLFLIKRNLWLQTAQYLSVMMTTYFFTSTGHKLISHPLVRYIEKAKEIITSTGDLMGGSEHPYLTISLYIRLPNRDNTFGSKI